MQLVHLEKGDAAPRTTPDAALSIQDLERRLRSHGPYVRIYAPQQQDSASGRLAADQAQGSPSGNGAPAQPQRAGPQSSSAAPAALAGAIPGLDVTFGTAKDLTVLDVTPSKGAASPSKFAAYPTVIRTPQSMGRVSIGASFNIPRAASPSPMTLARPVSSRSGPRYARSNSASRSSHAQDYSHRTGGDDNEMSPQQQMLAEEMLSTPFLPFLTLTNSLQLYLKLAVLDDSERIICWNPGSFLLQTSPFVGMPGTSANSTPRQSAAARLFSISAIRSLVRSMSARDETAYPAAPPTSPGYLLLTSSAVYIFRPIFSLYSLKLPLKDEQTTYLDPSALLQLVCKFPHSDIVRLDVGPSRQHLCFRVRQLPSGTAALSPSALIPAQTTSGTTPAASPQPSVRSNGAAASSALSGSKPLRIKIDSWVFLARSRMCTNQIVEYLTASLHEMLAEHVMPSQSAGLVNQDIEPVLRNLQASVFLRPGRKDVRVLTYEHVWPTPRSSESEQPKSSNGGGSVCVLAESESDPAADAEITKVDFDFLRFYLLGCFMRYIRPVPELPARSVKLEHVSIVGTAVYIYLVSERFDVWPPLIVPDEFSPHPSVNARIEGVSQLAPLDASGKGLTADIVPEFEHVLGVGRVADILRVERWRTWRIDAALGLPGEPPCEDLRGLGEALQNGYLGFVGADASKMGIAEQHGSAGGWLWWVRIVFGERDPEADSLEQPATPVSAPRSIPTTTGGERVGFWWDLAFSNRDAVDELLDAIRRLRAHPGASYEDQMHTNGDSLEGHIEQPQAAPQAPQLPQARQIPPPSIILGDD
ncbi:hypothetical protein HK105_200506 [Polyrhizophydium stewartii]|uniref:Uncharacterized protein n=1 Tax=Polyrhizophydium stewartii TaxID=2732419 RepID=A0ABR4NJH9_9FUNG